MRKLLGAIAILGLTASSASEAPLDITNILGAWVNAVGGVVNFNNDAPNQGTDQIRWGGSPSVADGSGYNFTPSGDINGVAVNTLFALGTFQHINVGINPLSAISAVDYNFSFDTNGVPAFISGVFTFTHNETPNSGICPPGSVSVCDDVVTVTNDSVNQSITVGDTVYFFNLVGFSTHGGASFANDFLSAEGGVNTAVLYAQVTSEAISEVPEPGTLVLFGTGIAAIVARRRFARS